MHTYIMFSIKKKDSLNDFMTRYSRQLVADVTAKLKSEEEEKGNEFYSALTSSFLSALIQELVLKELKAPLVTASPPTKEDAYKHTERKFLDVKLLVANSVSDAFEMAIR